MPASGSIPVNSDVARRCVRVGACICGLVLSPGSVWAQTESTDAAGPPPAPAAAAAAPGSTPAPATQPQPAPAPAASATPGQPQALPAPLPAAQPAPAAPAPYPPATAYPPPPLQPGGYYGAPMADSRPMYLHYESGQPVPEGYYVQTRPIKGLIIAGSITLGVPYVLGLTLAAESDFDKESGWLAVPVLGPFIAGQALDEEECEIDEYDYYDCEENDGYRTLYALDGVIQATGAVLFTIGMAVRRTRLVRNDIAGVTVTPVRFRSGYGLGAMGVF